MSNNDAWVYQEFQQINPLVVFFKTLGTRFIDNIFLWRDFHAATTWYAEEDPWMIALSSEVERWREWPRGDVLFENW